MNNDQRKDQNKKPRKAPVIKQTLASIYRLAKTNPLAVKENHIVTEDDKYRKIKLPQAVTSIYGSNVTGNYRSRDADVLNNRAERSVIRPSKSTSSLPRPSTSTTLKQSTASLPFSTKPTKSLKFQFAKPSTSTTLKHSTSLLSLPSKPTKSLKLQLAKPSTSKPTKTVKHVSTKEKFQKRRSRSAEKFVPKVIEPSQPEKDILKAKLTQSQENLDTIFKQKKVTFQSPSAYLRRSNIKPRFFNSSTSTPLQPECKELSIRLNNWLKQHGKTPSSYHHLKCFNMPVSIVEQLTENKENIEGPSTYINSSYEDLEIDLNTEGAKAVASTNNAPTETEATNLVKDALYELNKLISENYPLDQCEFWLANIRDKYKNIEDTSEYWECRAAIEQNRENITLAVEFYQKAIVKGAEIESVDGSLEGLLEKFSLLNIDPSTSSNKMMEKRKMKIQKEAKNVFKSTIIQFALLKQKELQKNNEERFVATPVKRSTRRSRCTYIPTPGIKIYNSLHDVEDSINLKTLSFKKNNFLK